MRTAAGGTDRPVPKPRELPDPDERARVYEAMQEHVSAETPAQASPGHRPGPGDQRSHRDEVPRCIREAEDTLSADAQAMEENDHGGGFEGAEGRLEGANGRSGNVSAETAEEASPNRGRDETNRRSYWDEVPRFLEMKADLEQRWTAGRRPAPDRSADPPGSYRSDGGFYLNPERHAETTAAIGRVHEAEPGISADICAAAQQNKYGGWLEGFGRRLKGEDRLKEKVAERREGAPDKAPADILRTVPDAIRFTLCFQPESYTGGYYDIKGRLASRGYELSESRNSWDGAEYKGINTRWVTREGQWFEVQFHTPESFHAKEYVTHKAYERIRNPLTKDEERSQLKTFQREVCAHIQVPNGALDIPDVKKKGL